MSKLVMYCVFHKEFYLHLCTFHKFHKFTKLVKRPLPKGGQLNHLSEVMLIAHLPEEEKVRPS